jgi:hypothetical protein
MDDENSNHTREKAQASSLMHYSAHGFWERTSRQRELSSSYGLKNEPTITQKGGRLPNIYGELGGS